MCHQANAAKGMLVRQGERAQMQPWPQVERVTMTPVKADHLGWGPEEGVLWAAWLRRRSCVRTAAIPLCEGMLC